MVVYSNANFTGIIYLPEHQKAKGCTENGYIVNAKDEDAGAIS